MFSKLAIAAAATLVLIAPALAQTDCTRTYTIKEGDICDWISESQGVSTYQLAAVNADIIDSTCGNLQIGENICLGRVGEDCTETYVVRDNDTCGSIQEQYGLNSTILMQNNPQIDEDCYNLYNGEVLCVATSVVAPAIPPGFFDNDDPSSPEWFPIPESEIDEDDDEDIPYCDEVEY